MSLLSSNFSINVELLKNTDHFACPKENRLNYGPIKSSSSYLHLKDKVKIS
jgi:hypothetical protein